MKTYKELTIAEAVGLSLNATACNPVRFAFKDRDESTVWTEAPLVGVNLHSCEPYHTGLGFSTELCAQVIEAGDVFVPWTFDTAPKGSVLLRGISRRRDVYLVVDWNYRGLSFGIGNGLPFLNLLEGYEHSLDGGKTWSPCGSKEVAK